VPQLVELREKFGAKGLQVIGLTPAADSAAEEFIAAHDVTYPILAAAHEEQQAYGVRYFPAVFLVNPAGRIVSQDLDEVEGIVAGEL
jgi:peroxiredoxin